MNRRTFLKSIGIAVAAPVTLLAGRTERAGWMDGVCVADRVLSGDEIRKLKEATRASLDQEIRINPIYGIKPDSSLCCLYGVTAK